MKRTAFLLSALSLGVVSMAAQAATTIYTSEAAFIAATVSSSFNFAGVTAIDPTDPAVSPVLGASVVVGGVKFTADSTTMLFTPEFFGFVVDGLPTYPTNFISFQTNDDAMGVTITTNASAFGFSYGSYSVSHSAPFTINTGEISLGPLEMPVAPNTGFIGFVSDAPIASIALSADFFNVVFDITDFRVGTASAVPEPSTWAMMLLGFGAIGFVTRRRQRQFPNFTFG